MKLVFTFIFMATVACLTLGQKVAGIVGTWVVDPKTPPPHRRDAGIQITFKPNGALAATDGKNKGTGTYTVAGNQLTLKIVHDGRTLPPRTATITANAILLPSGVKINGKEVMIRLIRKK